MEIVLGGTKQDEAPISHTTASPHCHKENASRKRHCRVHLAVVVKATARQLDEPCDSLAGCQHFKMPNVMQATYFGSHLVVI